MARSYPSRPVLGVGAIILDGDRVLLVQRARHPHKGLWSIPGGGLELGETIENGVRREVLEETGLEVHVGELIEVFERIQRDAAGEVEYHYVVADYRCEYTGGEPRAGDDAAAVRWVERSAMGELEVTSGARTVIEKAFERRDRP